MEGVDDRNEWRRDGWMNGRDGWMNGEEMDGWMNGEEMDG